MGRSTWISIPEAFRLLSDRLNIILSSSGQSYFLSAQDQLNPNILVLKSLDEALETIQSTPHLRAAVEQVRLFEEALFHPWFETLHMTQIKTEFECDTFLSEKSIGYISGINLEEHLSLSGMESITGEEMHAPAETC